MGGCSTADEEGKHTQPPPPPDTWIFPSGRKLKLPGHEVAPLLSIAHRSLGTAAALSESETKAPAVMHYLPCRQREPKPSSPPGGGDLLLQGEGTPAQSPSGRTPLRRNPAVHTRGLLAGESSQDTQDRGKRPLGGPPGLVSHRNTRGKAAGTSRTPPGNEEQVTHGTKRHKRPTRK